MKISPCYNCEDRGTACHDTCELYASWAKQKRMVLNKRKGMNMYRAEREESYWEKQKGFYKGVL